jgi:phosphoribosylglycinamide formyltransferase-1
MKRIAIFASGTGSNAKRIIEHFHYSKQMVARVELVVSNKHDAGVLQIAKKANIPAVVISKAVLNNEPLITHLLENARIDFIALAGFLLLIPDFLIKKFHRKIVNIHPALLPQYGGKGMYGMYVHEAVWKNREKQTGITIHYANENYDEGDIIFQAKTDLEPTDTPETIAKKVQRLEHQYYPLIIEKLIADNSF